MSNLDNIIQTILKDAKLESENILKDANEKKNSYIVNMENKAKEENTQLIAKANLEAEQVVEKALNNARLRARDKILEAKQEKVSKVLELVKDKFKNLDDKTYTEMLISKLKTSNVLEEDEIMVQQNKLESVKALDLKNKISEKFVESGFSFIGKNSIMNNDFSSLVDYMSDDLESFIAEKLFVD